MPSGIAPTIFTQTTTASERRTFAELKRELSQPFNPGDPHTVALAADSMNAAIRIYSMWEWPWEITTADNITLTSGQRSYALPQSFKKPLEAYLLRNNLEHQRLVYEPYDTFCSRYSQEENGQPTSYTLRNVFEDGQIHVHPIPTSTYTMRVRYYRRTPTMVHDDTPVEFPPEAEQAIMSWAMYEMFLRLGGTHNLQRVTVQRQMALQARAELVAMVNDRGDNTGLG